MSRHPQVINQRWLCPRCFPLMFVRWVAPSLRETGYIPHHCHLSPVRVLINILQPIHSKPDYLRYCYYTLLIRLWLWLPLACTSKFWLPVFDLLPTNYTILTIVWVCIYLIIWLVDYCFWIKTMTLLYPGLRLVPRVNNCVNTHLRFQVRLMKPWLGSSGWYLIEVAV